MSTRSDARGSLTFVEGGNHVPFDIRRVYYLYDFADGTKRGGHAHRALRQLMIAVSGSFDVLLDDGHEQRRFRLATANRGLLVPAMTWRWLENFSAGAVCCVLASAPYDEIDYIRDYERFLRAV